MDDSGTNRRPFDGSAGAFGQGDHPLPSAVRGTGRDHRKWQGSDECVSRPDKKHLPAPANGGQLSRWPSLHVRPPDRSNKEVQPDTEQQENRTGWLDDRAKQKSKYRNPKQTKP